MFSILLLIQLQAHPAHAESIRESQWHLRYLNVSEAHQASQGADTTVAVIDTGVDPHPDLINNLTKGTSLVEPTSGGGQQDVISHGTGMAGIIAAHGQEANGGVLGIAPKARILPVRDQTSEGSGNADTIAMGIRYAVERRVDVINISSSSSPSPELSSAVELALQADIVVTAGAGNSPASYGITFPAAIPGVIAVGAADQSGNISPISVSGRELDLVAPGTEIVSTGLGKSYRKGTGTSDAAAIVAGAAALVRSKFPNLPAEEVVHRLTATAIDKGAPGRDDEYGYGVLDLVAALTADVPPLGFESTTAPEPASASPSTTAVAAPGDGAGGGGRLLLGLGTAVVAVVGTMLFLRSRRRRASGVAGAGPASR